jgi:2Fe-2S ferredoxin
MKRKNVIQKSSQFTKEFVIMQDGTIHITDREGKRHSVLAPTDMAMNLMEVVRSFELAPEGIIGVCGGMAMCASCQCYVNSDHELNEKGDEEDAMLSEAFNVKGNSRLSCQIPITETLNELEIELAPEY